MRVVAEHLEEHCKQLTAPCDRDHFARSAFNRYYYAIFLTIRSTLAKIDPNWDEPTHRDVPILLRNSVVKKLRRRSKGHVMSEPEAAKLSSQGCTAAKALADLVETGNETRKLADYAPERPVLFENATISLGGVKTSTARKWCIDAETRCQVLLNAAKKFGLC